MSTSITRTENDTPLTSQSLLNLLQGPEFQTALLKCIQPLFALNNQRLAYLEDAFTKQKEQMTAMRAEMVQQKLTIQRLAKQVTTSDRQAIPYHNQARNDNLVVSGIEGDNTTVKEQFITLASEKFGYILKDNDFNVTKLRKTSCGPAKALLVFSRNM